MDTAEISLFRECNTLLADLDPYNYKKIGASLKQLQIDNEDRLKGLVCSVYENAFTNFNYSKTFCELSKLLVDIVVPSNQDPKTCIDYSTLLSKRCARELASDYQFDSKIKRMRFFAELFKEDILNSDVIFRYIEKALRNGLTEEKIKCLSRLFSFIGKKLDNISDSTRLNVIFNQLEIESKTKSEKRNSKCQLMLMNVIEFRNSGWRPDPTYNHWTSRPLDLDFYEKKLSNIIPTRFSTKFKRIDLLDKIEVIHFNYENIFINPNLYLMF